MILCKSDGLTIRDVESKDKEILLKWLTDKSILEYYEGRDSNFNMETIERKFFKEDHAVRCIIEYEKKAVGYIQFYEIDDEERMEYEYTDASVRIYGADQFIGETSYWSKGIGTLLMKTIINYLINTKKADKVVLDPHANNPRALRCYEKSGFKKVKLLPKHELHEGILEDCWLMEYNNR